MVYFLQHEDAQIMLKINLLGTQIVNTYLFRIFKRNRLRFTGRPC